MDCYKCAYSQVSNWFQLFPLLSDVSAFVLLYEVLKIGPLILLTVVDFIWYIYMIDAQKTLFADENRIFWDIAIPIFKLPKNKSNSTGLKNTDS